MLDGILFNGIKQLSIDKMFPHRQTSKLLHTVDENRHGRPYAT